LSLLLQSWIPTTLLAAFLQNLRTVMQRQAAQTLSTAGVTFSRFLWGAPAALVYLAALAAFEHTSIPAANKPFLAYALIGGVGQILGNALLVHSFRFRNFLVATAYSKTEVGQTAIFSALWLREPPTLLAGLGIGISMAGVIALSLARGQETLKSWWHALLQRPALYGLGVGASYAVATIAYRAGALALPHGDAALRAATTLAWVTGIQALLMAPYLMMRERGELSRVLRAPRVAVPIGLSGAIASAAWFTAMSLENVSYVRALGQAELVFTLLSSHHLFGERSNKRELLGVLLTVTGILLVLFGR